MQGAVIDHSSYGLKCRVKSVVCPSLLQKYYEVFLSFNLG